MDRYIYKYEKYNSKEYKKGSLIGKKEAQVFRCFYIL